MFPNDDKIFFPNKHVKYLSKIQLRIVLFNPN